MIDSLIEDDDIIHRTFIRPTYDLRTFETRLLFIKDIFENTFSRSDIMGRCILYKLNGTYNKYQQDLKQGSDLITEQNPVTMLNKLAKIK